MNSRLQQAKDVLSFENDPIRLRPDLKNRMRESTLMLTALLASLDGALAMAVLDVEESRVMTFAGHVDPERLKILPFAAAEILSGQRMHPIQAVFARRAEMSQDEHRRAVSEAMTISDEGFCLFQRAPGTPHIVLVTLCNGSANLALVRAQTRKALSDVSSTVQT